MHFTRQASYAVIVILFILLTSFGLNAALLAGLFSYLLLDLTDKQVRKRLGSSLSRWASLIIFILLAAGISWMFVHFVRQLLSTLSEIVEAAIPKLLKLSDSFGIEIPFGNGDELKDVILDEVKFHTHEIAHTTRLLSKDFFRIVLGIVIAILGFFDKKESKYIPNLYDALSQEVNVRARIFIESFEKVFGAQMIISATNSVLTGIFLSVMGFPHILFLVLTTFIFGALPVVGNILSNTIIVATALTLSTTQAVAALAFLVSIHTAEYFLNSRIMGSSIDAPMWQTLTAILVGEVVMGIPGIILAPTILHYLKTEMQLVPMELP